MCGFALAPHALAPDGALRLFISYLRCAKWNEKEAIKRLESTLKWRREFGVYDVVTAEQVEPEVNASHMHASPP